MMDTNTPYFLIHEDILNSNIENFDNALSSEWKKSQLCYSVKTNSLPWLIEYLNKRNIFAEVVSDEEYALALAVGVSDSHIVFNGPIKGETFFYRALKNGAVINLDSIRDVQYLTKYKEEVCPEKIGIRVNIPSEIFDKEDIGHMEDGFRFGFSPENREFQMVIETMQTLFPNSRFGLHLHINSVTRSLNVYRTIASYAASILNRFHLNVSFIDIGGGFFGGVEGKPLARDYIRAIREEIKDEIDFEKVTLYVEPGSAIIGSAADLVTTVIDTKETPYANIITTDGSRIHIDPLWKKNQYRYFILPGDTKSDIVKRKQIICGYTCMDHDRIMILNNERALCRGDKIVYQRVGAYTITFGGAFISYLPEVYVESKGEFLRIRGKMSVDDYISLHSEKHMNDMRIEV